MVKYKPIIEHIRYLARLGNIEESINTAHQTIQDLRSILQTSNSVLSIELYQLVIDCTLITQQNYQLIITNFLQEVFQQSASYLLLNNFFDYQILLVEKFIKDKQYLQALSLIKALKICIYNFHYNFIVKFPFLLSNFLNQCDLSIEYIYFSWLKTDYREIMNYFFAPSASKLCLQLKLIKMNKHLASENYQGAINLQTKLLQIFKNLLNDTIENSATFTSAWHKFLVYQRQQTAFNWLIKEGPALQRNKKFFATLQNDLIFLIQEGALWKPIMLEAQTKLYLLNLLLMPSFHRTDLDTFRQGFCLAFDSFHLVDDKPNIALTLLGLALINAYEGEKQQMLIGVKCVTEYDTKLKALTKIIFDQLPFYRKLIDETVFKLVNPFDSWKLIENKESFSFKI